MLFRLYKSNIIRYTINFLFKYAELNQSQLAYLYFVFVFQQVTNEANNKMERSLNIQVQ